MKSINKSKGNEMLPKGWQELKLGDIYDISAGGDFNPQESSLVQDQRHYYPIYSNALTNKGLYGYSTYAKHDADAITITARGDIGVANHRDTKFVAIGRLLVLKNKIQILNKFVSEYINHKIKFLKETTGVPQLTVPQVSAYWVTFPPLAEQKAIVAVLETWDRAIEKTGQLIQAKEKQFKWLLKKLITDQQQNPTWQKVKLGDIFKLGRGRVISKKEIENNPGKFPVYSSQTFNNGELGRINTYDFEGDYVTWTTDGANAGAVFYRTGKFNCTNVCGTAKPIEPKKISCQFISYSLIGRTKKYVSYVGNHKLMNDVFSEILFFLPISKVEQNKIARILYIAQQEIDLLKKTVEKYQIQKKGLMQKLLTGQWRLKV